MDGTTRGRVWSGGSRVQTMPVVTFDAWAATRFASCSTGSATSRPARSPVDNEVYRPLDRG